MATEIVGKVAKVRKAKAFCGVRKHKGSFSYATKKEVLLLKTLKEDTLA